MFAADATLAADDAIEATHRAAARPTRARDLDVPREELPRIAEATLKNFNANQGLRSAESAASRRSTSSRRPGSSPSAVSEWVAQRSTRQ